MSYAYDLPPRCESPGFVPQSLPVPRRPRAASKRASAAPALHARDALALADADVADPILTHSRHVYVRAPEPSAVPLSALPPSLDLTPYTSASTPSATHVLALYDASAPTALLVPVHAPALARSLRADLALPPGAPPGARGARIRVPVVPLAVPHAATAPLLLLFALRAHPRGPRALIPGGAGAASVGEAARALAAAGGLERRVAEHQGAWRNALALGVRDEDVVEALRFVWEATVEARRLGRREN